MRFVWDGQERQLYGMNQPPIRSVSKKEESREAQQKHTLLALCTATTPEQPSPPTKSEMQELLTEYGNLFREPEGLPPPRKIEHRIILQEGTEPINIRPYRYAHFQKTEIEKQVNHMLDSGLIRPNTSPFSSLVLLVQKKDKT